ncbi:MAG: HD domain-containing protein [Thermoplasmata archaeon]|nr:HD domain-containing protein [Thermoplasmata archaeon]
MPSNFKIIHDSIHGSIRIEEPLTSILETPEMQRLSNVRQLGLNYLVFPGANHTRFEHCLGVSHLSGEIGRILNLSEREIKMLRIAGLIHDIGHPPFSHTLERLIKMKIGLDHVQIGSKIIKNEIKISEKFNEKSIGEIIQENGLDMDEIISLFMNKTNEEIFGKKEKRKYLSKIINGDLDADQLDYLLRDSHYTGVAYGIIDIQRILNTITIFDDDIVFYDKGIESLESVMVARALMYSSVYFHKTARIAELMLSRAIENMENLNFYDILSMNDSELISMLLQSEGYAKDIGTRIKFRQLFKKVAIFENIPDNFDPKNLKKLEKELAYESDAPEGYVLIDFPIEELSINEPRMNYLDVKILKNGKKYYLKNESSIVKALRSRKPIDYSLMIVAEKSYLENVKKVLKRIF